MNNSNKEKKISWSEECYKVDPSLNAPKPMYIFNNGNRVFYSKERKVKVKK